MSLYPQLHQRSELLLQQLLDRPLTWAPDQKIIYRDLREFTYREFLDRVRRAAALLQGLGVQPGDRVGVIDWDSHRYLELFFAVPLIGAVLHTLNPRLAPSQLLFTLEHGGDSLVLLHPDFLPLVEPLAPHCPQVRRFVLLSDDGTPVATPLALAGDYEALLAAASPLAAFPVFPEDTVATLFYTTGTTGDPKGVFFTHRQLVLHTIAAGFGLAAFPDPAGLHYRDVYMPLTPMFHVHAWGVPYIATALGLRQVYPGRYEPGLLLRLIAQHRVTISHGVPTLIQMLLHHPDSQQYDLSGLKIITGGAALPPAVAREAMERGIHIVQGYGMSETCPVIALSQYKQDLSSAPLETQLDILNRTGFPIPLVRARAMDAAGQLLPPGREHAGELVLQAPWLTPGYFRDPERSEQLWAHGWMHTGDLAYLDPDGYIRITDRLKDVIKVGGEWISSLELEHALGQHPAVREAAVLAMPDPKWDERPRALVVLRDPQNQAVTPKDLLQHLRHAADQGLTHKRAILTRIEIVDQLPRTSVGKVDKKHLRAQLLQP